MIEDKPSGSTEHEIEQLVNQAHLDTNANLRCCISVKADSLNHFFIYQVLPGDKMYMVLKFHDHLQKSLDAYKKNTKMNAA